MSALANERAAIIDALDLPDGRQAHPILPDALVPPCAVVVPGAPYMERRTADTFGSVTGLFELWLIADQGTNAEAIAALDEVIESQIERLARDGFAIEQVAEPFAYTPQHLGGTFLTSTVTLSTTICFT